MGDSSSTATAAVLLTVLQESTGRLATILFAHRFGQAIEPECKMYRFLADVLNDGALALDVLSPALIASHYPYARALALCASGVLRALCGVAAGAAKASLSAHFARGGNGGNLAELNAKDGSQETVISLLGMLAGSLFVRAVNGTVAVWLWMVVLVAVHLATNYAAVRAVQLRTLNRQRAKLVLHHYQQTGGVLSPGQAAAQERILTWHSPGISFARSHPRSGEISAYDLHKYRNERYVIVTAEQSRRYHNSGGGRGSGARKIFMKEGATARNALEAWLDALLQSGEGVADSERGEWKMGKAVTRGNELLDDHEFWMALDSAGWDLDTAALETGSAIRIRVE